MQSFFLFEKFGDKEFVYIIRLVLDFMQFGTVFTEKSRFLTECFEFVHGFAYIGRFLPESNGSTLCHSLR